MYHVQRIEVVLTVPSIEETAVWYEQVLGWTAHYDAFDDQGNCLFGSVSVSLEPFVGFNLARLPAGGGPGLPVGPRSSAWVFVDDVDALYGRVVENGGLPDAPPEEQFWGSRTFKMKDVNGFEITFVHMLEEEQIP
jgi:predicted enzyme related to lactoylglutathione lyase